MCSPPETYWRCDSGPAHLLTLDDRCPGMVQGENSPIVFCSGTKWTRLRLSPQALSSAPHTWQFPTPTSLLPLSAFLLPPPEKETPNISGGLDL